MKKLLFSFLLLAASSTALFSQKTINDANAEKRSVGSFHGIDVGTGIELSLTEGTSEEVAVSAATTEWRDKIVTKVENGILKIYYENKFKSMNNRKEKKELKAYVSYKMLDKLQASTGADVKIVGVLKSATLDIDASTGAIINGEVSASSLKVDQSTGSKVTLSGKADKLEISGDTGSRFKGEEMATSNCSASVSTGATVAVKAEKELQVKANTGGKVTYTGNAVIKEVKTSTGGSVSKI